MKKEIYEKPKIKSEEIKLGSFGCYNEWNPIFQLTGCINLCCD